MVRLSLLCTCAVLLAVGSLHAQDEESAPAVGYLRIFTDTDLVQIHLDGELIGYSPVLEKLTLTPGWHTVSFFPPGFRWTHWTHMQRKMMVEVIEAGTKHVLVEPGELAEVYLPWRELEQQLQRYEAGRRISTILGMGMVAVVLFLLAKIA